MRLWMLLALLALASLATGQGRQDRTVGARPNPSAGDRPNAPLRQGECQYTFTVTAGAMQDSCRTSEVNALIEELNNNYKSIQQENENLKKEIDSIRKDYENMVEGVKKLEGDTKSWREIIEWPQIEMPFKPDNVSMLVMKEPNFPDCYTAWQNGGRREGIYMLKPPEAMVPFFAYCDKEGWTVFQRRFDGTVDFYKSWDDYSKGFGRMSGEFWMGLENIFLLTDVAPYELRIEALGWNSKLYHANYDNFRVLGEREEYKLIVGNMTKGNIDDVLSAVNGSGFTTFDRDNDDWYSANCAEYYRGAFWLPNCGDDPNRRWCETRGCMTWGEKVIKKSVFKMRPMSVKSGGAPAGRRQAPPEPEYPQPDHRQPGYRPPRPEIPEPQPEYPEPQPEHPEPGHRPEYPEPGYRPEYPEPGYRPEYPQPGYRPEYPPGRGDPDYREPPETDDRHFPDYARPSPGGYPSPTDDEYDDYSHYDEGYEEEYYDE